MLSERRRQEKRKKTTPGLAPEVGTAYALVQFGCLSMPDEEVCSHSHCDSLLALQSGMGEADIR